MKDKDHVGEETLQLYLDDELGPAARSRAEAHLAGCSRCQGELEELRRLYAAIEELSPALSPNLAPGVLARLEPRGRIHPLLWGWLNLQAAAALLLLVLGWPWLERQWSALAGAAPLGLSWAVELFRGPQRSWAALPGWIEQAVGALASWPARLWSEAQGGWAALPRPSLPAMSPYYLAVALAVVAAGWFVGNLLLLRRARVNGH